MLRYLFPVCISWCAVLQTAAQSQTPIQVMNLDSLSTEDSLLLAEMKSEWMQEVSDIKAAFHPKKMKSAIDTTVALMNRSSHVEIGLDALGPVYANGRATGIEGAAIFTSVMYYHKLGFYGALNLGFYTDSFIRKAAPVPVVSISPGFYRTFFKRWSLGAGYSRNFALYAGNFERGLLNNSISISNSYDFWNYLSLNLHVNVSWSSNLNSKKSFTVNIPPLPPKKVEYKQATKGLGQGYATSIVLGLKKDITVFNFVGAKTFTITPSFQMLFGNDNNTYILRSVVNGRIQPPQSDRFFGLLNIQPSLSVNWRIRNLEIYGTFNLAIPFNEFDENSFTRIRNPRHYYPFGEGGVRYFFRVKKKVK
ncbi:MAG: hypothetical protein IPN22_06980 [Bacteroidetes bacterium]|nr:hypothetical protein [Bacteroidota bacterium]